MPRNESPENTVMRDVPPGDVSGVYHIIVSGLPFGTIWQLLKDWLRQAGCDVDHIEVFQKSTSGWIRLIGRDNFERALNHLKTVPYNNRLLLYLDKNRTESVKIMELLDDPPPKPKLGGGSQASRSRGKMTAAQRKTARGDQGDRNRGRPQARACVGQAAPTPAADAGRHRGTSPGHHETAAEPQNRYRPQTEPLGAARWGWQHSSTYEQPVNLSGGAQPSIGRAPRLGPTDTEPSKTPKPPLSSWAGSTTTPPDSSQKTGPPAAAASLPSPQTRDERRRVLLLSLRHGASPQDVEDWVRSRMGDWASAISHIDIPVDPRRGRIQGSGHITLLSSAAAKRAVAVLDQKLFLGRLVHARLADARGDRFARGPRRGDSRQPAASGSAPGRKTSPGPPAQQQQQQDPAGGNKVDKDDGRSSTTSTTTKSFSPVIAHGTYYRPQGTAGNMATPIHGPDQNPL